MSTHVIARSCLYVLNTIQYKMKWYRINGIRLIGLEVIVGFRVTLLLGHGPQLLRGLCPVHVLGGGGRTCCLGHT